MTTKTDRQPHTAQSITALKGVGPKKAAILAKKDVYTIEDLLYLFPRDYQDRTECCPIADLSGEKPALVRCVIERVASQPYSYTRGRKGLLRLIVSDESGTAEVVFFNASYLAKQFHRGDIYWFYGLPRLSKGKWQLIHPEFSGEEEERGIVPVYPLVSGIGQLEMRRLLEQAVQYAPEICEYLPEELLVSERLCGIAQALLWVHFPETKKQLELARHRFIYDELLTLQLGIQMMKRRNQNGTSMDADYFPFVNSLRFPLTGAQERVLTEIRRDMASSEAMNRLVQGDVGSGKTAVAEAAFYMAVQSGMQGAMMAPSELLAKQHFEGLSKDFEPFGIHVGLLTGHMTAKEKREQLEKLACGETDIIVGTHALLEPGVQFRDLGLVVTDEQHRFGVMQRKSLIAKGEAPDVLVMTATPIPRTLAVVMYGDLDISVIDELPQGRKPVETKAVKESARNKVYHNVEFELSQGRQAYVVAPLLEDSEAVHARSAVALAKDLEKRFPDYRVGLVHGEMKQEEKDGTMQDFRNQKIDVLVATVVIEVGINVPNATVMVIENCERFGLAQLHQLRGRVGRGADQSYCYLVCGKDSSDIALERVRTMTESNDGFYIAEKDLHLRGPGEIFGEQQHGLPDMRLADMIRHADMMEMCRTMAMRMLKEDPKLEAHPDIRRQVERAFGKDLRMTM